MTKNGVFLTIILALLGAAYVTYFTDWFRAKSIRIIPMIRPDRASRIPRGDDIQVYPVAFKLDHEYRLTEVKVVLASELSTNAFAAPLWHMVADSQSAPVDSIVYGSLIKGMKPKVSRAKPMPLDPYVAYVLMVQAGSITGQTNFYTKTAIKP